MWDASCYKLHLAAFANMQLRTGKSEGKAGIAIVSVHSQSFLQRPLQNVGDVPIGRVSRFTQDALGNSDAGRRFSMAGG
jgi:hypothetical protein